jgi:hypothetical protein
MAMRQAGPRRMTSLKLRNITSLRSLQALEAKDLPPHAIVEARVTDLVVVRRLG